MRNADQLGLAPESQPESGAAYDHPAEIGLLALLADHPRTMEAAARHRAPDRLARHLVAVADAFFRFQELVQDLFQDLSHDRLQPSRQSKPPAVHRARPALADATGAVLAGGLHLLGISAPDHL
ncbi:arginyl-tRNA synthetase [Streptomyces malaysiensis subsp. malaysiensis]|nr:arginyl-tRNA synthetase [Streptomyces malaysiensis]